MPYKVQIPVRPPVARSPTDLYRVVPKTHVTNYGYILPSTRQLSNIGVVIPETVTLSANDEQGITTKWLESINAFDMIVTGGTIAALTLVIFGAVKFTIDTIRWKRGGGIGEKPSLTKSIWFKDVKSPLAVMLAITVAYIIKERLPLLREL